MNLFLSGFIFMCIYDWLNNRKQDISITMLWSVFISVLIKSLCSTIHYFFCPNIVFQESLKVIIYACVGIILSFILTWLKKVPFIQKFLYKTNNKSVNDDIFEDIIDYKKRTMMYVYLKSSNVYYLGRFLYREENGLDSWIAFVDYCSIDKETNKVVYNPDEYNFKSSILFNMKDIERIEIIYEDDSEVWKRFEI